VPKLLVQNNTVAVIQVADRNPNGLDLDLGDVLKKAKKKRRDKGKSELAHSGALAKASKIAFGMPPSPRRAIPDGRSLKMDGSYDVITPCRPEAPARGTSFEELVYRQDLNEVYLLLDFISGRPDKRLSDLDNKISDPQSDDKHRMSSAEIIARVSEMRYPPDPPARERATDAAFLLELKDCLNWMAYPARGLTIAYTTMFAEGGHVSANAIWNAVLGILGRRLAGSTGAAAEPSRVHMAQLAFRDWSPSPRISG
jgi:hypothetical protein